MTTQATNSACKLHNWLKNSSSITGARASRFQESGGAKYSDRTLTDRPLSFDTFDFLYENRGSGTTITFRPGVAFCLRRFYELITDVVRGAWVHYIREQNAPVLGAHTDLDEFLFGSERSDLSAVRAILAEVQSNACFYCAEPLRRASQVDHFIPWTVYPVDLGHNFVLAHDSCNAAKSSRLAAGDHLQKWLRRNTDHGAELEARFDASGVMQKLPASIESAEWAYSRASATGAMAWQRRNELKRVDSSWLAYFNAARPGP